MKVGKEEVYMRLYSGNNQIPNQYIYFWKHERFFFTVSGTDSDGMFELIKWIVNKYTNEDITHIETVEIVYDCGNGKCDNLEDSTICCPDCGCPVMYDCIDGVCQ